eukprot:TRINITY_DN4594_c1_g1_i1.p1 TRINITY_DN4594_c1_g1~~TRINITY_DN4594_c1_g1_i1.p1  ORF type:complete len:145 (+),score=52.05 TRINITY_DN4594_c1_g1_i1:571-1005(+)
MFPSHTPHTPIHGVDEENPWEEKEEVEVYFLKEVLVDGEGWSREEDRRLKALRVKADQGRLDGEEEEYECLVERYNTFVEVSLRAFHESLKKSTPKPSKAVRIMTPPPSPTISEESAFSSRTFISIAASLLLGAFVVCSSFLTS